MINSEMIGCLQFFTLEQLSQIISIATPLILLLWFYYSQTLVLSKNYFEEIVGEYGGFTESVSNLPDKKKIAAGIIMHIRDINTQGYFKGEFEYSETQYLTKDNNLEIRQIRLGSHTFFGKMNFRPHLPRNRNPFKPKQNRIYHGKFYLVTRLDFLFDTYKIEDYLHAEYNIIHYREMQTLKFKLSKNRRNDNLEFPKEFTLYKSAGFDFEPLKSVKKVVFVGQL